MNFKKVYLNENKDTSISVYLLDNSDEFANIGNRPAILIFPGGGYYSTSDREAEPIAMAYLAEGYNAFILRYSVGKESSFLSALDDAEKALELIHENARAWNIDKQKIAVIGFSAGGHLAASLGTMGKNRPNALILGYPCILNKFLNILAFPVPSLEKEVDECTPPTFLFSTFEDELVPIENTLSFMKALNDKKIPFESHIFQKGVHGLSLAKPLSSSGVRHFVDKDFAQWFNLSVSWLHRTFGDYQAERESAIPHAKHLLEYSIEASLESLLENEDCRNLLLEYVPVIGDDEAIKAAKPYSLKMINQNLPTPLSDIKLVELNKRLQAIVFKG